MRGANGNSERFAGMKQIIAFFTLRKELRWIRCRQRVNLWFCLTLILS